MPVSRAEFARLAGVSRPAVTKALRGPLSAALVGPHIDPEHPIAAAYIAKERRAPTPRTLPLTDAELDRLALRLLEHMTRRLRRSPALPVPAAPASDAAPTP